MKPKIKVMMPKLEALKGVAWTKELLMSFIGTSLSIVLTFGTAYFVEEKHKREAGRQTAMMVIHDMENTADMLTAWENEEEQNYNCARYVLEHLDEIDAISRDTMQTVTIFLVASGRQDYYYDASCETLFLSSQDVWKNIDCPSFIDAVQYFFNDRRLVFENINKDGGFVRPVSNEEYYALLMSDRSNQKNPRSFGQIFADEILSKERVRSYINYSYQRRNFLSDFAKRYRSLANDCKFMMDISDSELRTYIASRKRTGHSVKEKNLIGRWEADFGSNRYEERTFLKDHSYVHTITSFYPHNYYTGKLEITYTWHGTWEIKGDTLIRVIRPECAFSMDKSKISYSKDKEEMVQQLLASWEEAFLTRQREYETEGEERLAALVAIDAAGEKIKVQTIPDENKQEETYYMVKLE